MSDNRPVEGRAKEIMAIADRLFSTRQPMETLWQQIADHYYPERANFTRIRSPGQEFADHLMTSYPVMLRRDLGNSFESLLRPKGGPRWFTLTTGREEIDEQDPVGKWLDNAGETVRRIIADRNAHFDRTMKQSDHDFAAFGNSVLSIEAHPAGIGIICQDWHLRDVAWSEDYRRNIETVARKLKMTAIDVVRKFKKGACDKVRELALKEPYTEINCYSVVIPADVWDYMPEGVSTETEKARLNAAKPWVALYVDRDHNEIMAEERVKRNPYVCPRWQLTSESPYGYSPATIVGLPDARLIQRMTLTMLESAEKGVDPPLKAMGEALRGGAQLFAGGLTYVDPEYDERTGKAIEPIYETQAWEPAKDFYERQMMLMKEAFYLNQLSVPDTKGMTAYQVSKLIEEFIRRSLPLLGPLADEHGKVLDKILEVAMDNNAFGDPRKWPDAMLGEDVAFRFRTPLQQAEEELKASRFANGLSTVVAPASSIDPSFAANIQVHEAGRDSLRGLGWDQDWLVPEDQVAQIKKQSGEKAQAEQALNAANNGAAVAANVGNAMSALKEGAAM